MADFEQGLDSILTDSLETPELYVPWDEPDAIPSSVSSGFLHLVSTLSDNSKAQLAPSIGSHKLGARLGLFFPLCLWLSRCLHPN